MGKKKAAEQEEVSEEEVSEEEVVEEVAETKKKKKKKKSEEVSEEPEKKTKKKKKSEEQDEQGEDQQEVSQKKGKKRPAEADAEGYSPRNAPPLGSPAAPSDPEAQKQLDQHIARLESLQGPEHARVRHWVIVRTLIRACRCAPVFSRRSADSAPSSTARGSVSRLGVSVVLLSDVCCSPDLNR